VNEPFNETQVDKIYSSDFVTSGTTATLTNTTLQNGHYHVRTRTVTTDGRHGAWHEFGTEGNTDFIKGNVGLEKTFGNSACFPNGSSGGVFGTSDRTKEGEVFSIPDIHTLNSITIGFASSTMGGLMRAGTPTDDIFITIHPADNLSETIATSFPIYTPTLPFLAGNSGATTTFLFLNGGVTLEPNKQYVFLLERSGALDEDNFFVNSIPFTFVPSCNFHDDAQYISINESGTSTQTADMAMGFSINYTTIAPDPVAAYNHSNVLFLPGIMGSRLSDATGEVRWLSEDDTEADYIRMNNDGTSALPDIAAKDAIDTADFQQGYTNIYKSFLNEMKNWETTYHITATTTPYDWRLDYDTVVTNGRKLANGNISYLVSPEAGHDPYILETLKTLASNSPTGKVTLIAHSQGGLIAKALMQKMGDAQTAQYIDKVILIATPQLGTPKAVGGLLNGFDMGILNAVHDEKIRQLAQNTPSAYNLLPSQNYFTYVDDPVIAISSSTLHSWSSVYGDIIHDQQNMFHFMTDTAGTRSKPGYAELNDPEIVQQSFLDRAKVVHDTLDAWTPPNGVQLTTIAGWGMETLSGIEYLKVHMCFAFNLGGECVQWGDVQTLSPQHVIDGDGTVVELSAQWANGAVVPSRYWVDLKGYNEQPENYLALGFIDRDHKNILEVEQLRTLLTNILTNKTSVLQYISTIAPTYSGDKPRLHFTLHSPLTLGFKDTQGNYSGATATSTLANIPGVTYERYGEVQWLSVPKELAGQLILQGTASGSFTLDAEEVNGNDILSTTSFEGIPSSTSTIVTMDIIPNQSVTASSTLVIDYNGDGTTDLTLPAKENSVVTLTTQKVPLTVTANNQTITLGSSLPTLTTTLSGFVNGDTATSSVNGVASCTTTATATSTVDTYPIICTKGTLTSDKYDFTTFATGTLTILYKWSGFTQPINDTVYNPTQNTSVFKGGSTVPVKFQLKNASGTSVQAITAPEWLTPQKLSPMSAPVDESIYSDPATSGTTYKWDGTQYHYNWKTKDVLPGYWYRIYTKLEDGTVQSVVVGIR